MGCILGGFGIMGNKYHWRSEGILRRKKRVGKDREVEQTFNVKER